MKIDSFKALARLLAQVEGGKKQVDIAQITEILSRLRVVFKAAPLAVLKVLMK